TALVSMTAGGVALADCQPDPAASGATVTCTGADTNGFTAGAAQNLTFNVVPGATVTTAANAIVVTLNAGNTIGNDGTITQTVGPQDALRLVGGANVLTNRATINASFNGIVSLGAGNVINNLGTIVSNGNGGNAIVTTADS